MHGDFSRDSFDPKSNFARVLMQQGRLIVDADWNEQSAILLHYIRTLAADLIGWHGGAGVTKNGNAPDKGPLAVTPKDGGYAVEDGRYYIHGIMTDWKRLTLPKKEEIANFGRLDKPDGADSILLFVDVFERMVSADERSELSDPGLGGMSTCSRQIVIKEIRGRWFKLLENGNGGEDGLDASKVENTFLEFIDKLPRNKLPQLVAFTKRDSSNKDDCSVDPSSGYTGLENQLYRIEVHFAGDKNTQFWDGKDEKGNINSAFSLKWSRDNGSIAYAGKIEGGGVKLASNWRDDSRAIQKGDYVELISGDNEPGILAKVISISEDDGQYTLKFDPEMVSINEGEKVLVRRWDHRNRKDFPIAKENGGFVVKAKSEEEKNVSVDIPIEDGIYVRLVIPGDAILQPGDYWLIPARAATGDILWRRNEDKTGVESYDPVNCCYTQHHYAPIALIAENGAITDLRRNIEGIAKT